MKRTMVLLTIATLLFTAIHGCSTVGKPILRYDSPVSSKMEAEFQEAENLYREGKHEIAAGVYRSYISKYRYNRLTDKAYYRLGSIFLFMNQPETAYSYFRRTTDENFHPNIAPWAQYRGSVCLREMGDIKKSNKLLERIPLRYQGAKLNVRIESLRLANMKDLKISSEEEIRQYLRIYNAYTMIDSEKEDADMIGYPWLVSKEEALEKIRKWVDDGKEDPREARKMIDEFARSEAGAYPLWKVAKRYYEDGKFKTAKSYAEYYIKLYPKHEYTSSAQIILMELEKHFGEYKIPIGVVLPLSGPYALYGESVLHGIECAAGIFYPCKSNANANVRLVVRDSAGTPEGAANAVKELAGNQEVVAIIGPLLRREVGKVVEEAKKLDIPLIALTQNAEVAQEGENIFQNFLTINEQVQTVVNYSCDGQKLKKFAILYPDSSIGNEFFTSFSSAVESCGGSLDAQYKYDLETNDFNNVVRGLKFAVKRYSYRSKAGFEALFIPDVYERVSEILKRLSFLDLEGVQLLGSAGWDHPDLAKKAGKEARGSVFVAGYYAKSSYPPSQDFATRFEGAYGFNPTLLEAYGFDSMGMIQKVIEVSGTKPIPTRSVVQRGLASLKGFEGVTGSISFDKNGHAVRDLFLLTISGGEIKEVGNW